MKKFKEFIKKPKVVVVDALPVHGLHAQPKKKKKKLKESTVVDTQPVHGEHAKAKPFSEFYNKNENSHLGETHEDVNEKLSNHYDHESLPQEHKDAISGYTDYSSDHNRHLINKELGNDSFYNLDWETREHYDRRTNHLNNMISNDKSPEEYTVYHGTGFNPDKFAKESTDRTIKMPAFTSTSTNPKTAAKFAKSIDYTLGSPRHILRIKIPKGSSISRHIGKNSSYPKEHETIVKNGLKLKIAENPEVYHHEYDDKNPQFDEGKYHVWNATVVD